MLQFIAFICMIHALFCFLEAHDNVCLSGKLVKKYYPAPSVIKNPAFGWYLELDNFTQEIIQHHFKSLKKEEQSVFDSLDPDLKVAQIVTTRDDIISKARSLEHENVKIEGKLLEPYFCRTFFCYSIEVVAITPIAQLDIQENNPGTLIDNLTNRIRRHSDLEYAEENPLKLPEDAPEKLVTLRGKLILNLYSGPPEYSSIEGGDRADYCWNLKLDQASFEIAITTPVHDPAEDLSHILEWSNHDEINLLVDDSLQDYLCKHYNKTVIVEGYLFHAHTAHHQTPILMDVMKFVSE